MDYNEKILTVLGFLVIIIFFIFYLDIPKIIITCLHKSSNNLKPLEHFNSYLFRPQKVFQNKGKIYLLDTQRVLEIDRNPKIFDTYNDYRKYLIELEKNLKENLITKIGSKKFKINEIEENEIPSLDIKLKKKIENDEINPYSKNYVCQRQSAHCDLNKKTTPFYNSIYNPEHLKKFQDEVCQKKILTDGQCEIVKTFKENADKINEICLHKNMSLPKFQNTFGEMCRKNTIINQEKSLLTKICNNESTNLEMCMLDDYFRENLLNSLAS